MLGVGFKNTWSGVAPPSGALAFLRASWRVQDRDHKAWSPWGGGEDSQQSPRWLEGNSMSHPRALKQHICILKIGFCLFACFFLKWWKSFFFIPFNILNFFLNFILKSEGEKNVCKQVGAQTQLLQKQSQPTSKCLVPLLAEHPVSTSIYGHSSTTVLFSL